MKIIIIIVSLLSVSAHVSGSIWKANEGEDVPIHFQCDLERVGLAKIAFEGGNKPKSLLARFCSHDEAAAGCDPVETEGVSLQVEGGNVSVVLHSVNTSRSGLYELQAFLGKHPCKKNAMLVVNKASSAAPSQTSIPNPPDSHHLLWLVALIPLVIVLGGVFFCKLRRMLCFQGKEVKKSCSDCVSVDMNGENTKVLLPS